MSCDLSVRRTALLAYAQSCLDAGDYHGCRDACTDLEVIEAWIEAMADCEQYKNLLLDQIVALKRATHAASRLKRKRK